MPERMSALDAVAQGRDTAPSRPPGCKGLAHRGQRARRCSSPAASSSGSPSPDLGISVFRYSGEVSVTIAADATLIPDPGAVLASFPDEIDALHQATASL